MPRPRARQHGYRPSHCSLTVDDDAVYDDTVTTTPVEGGAAAFDLQVAVGPR